jgi:hypothetical protein
MEGLKDRSKQIVRRRDERATETTKESRKERKEIRTKEITKERKEGIYLPWVSCRGRQCTSIDITIFVIPSSR